MSDWNKLPEDEVVTKTVNALKANGITVFILNSGKEAKNMVLDMIPPQSHVIADNSPLLEAIGLKHEIDDTDRFKSKNRDPVPSWIVGSLSAVSEDGQIFFSSNIGDYLPFFSYTAPHVILICSTNKIAPNFNQAMLRINELNKLLIINKETVSNRISLLFIKEDLGF